MIKKIGILTSGGDSPGMNAAIRAAFKTCIHNGIEPYGIMEGYRGLIDGNIHKMESEKVDNIIQRGGTILKSSRCQRFLTKRGRTAAYKTTRQFRLDGILAIGGDGTFEGASIFYKEHNIPLVGIPGTIDNDLFGTDFTIGYDTALNTVVEAIDKIRDTASSHNSLFIVEVMGKDAGIIALRSGIGVGASIILIPEITTDMDELIENLERDKDKQGSSRIIVVAEGDDAGGAFEIARQIKQKNDDYQPKVTVLGHIQRGGNPTAMDRVLASRMGYESIIALIKKKTNVMVGVINNEIVYTPFEDAIKQHNKQSKDLLNLAKILSLKN